MEISLNLDWLPDSSWTALDWTWFIVSTGISLAIAVASYRRSRHLSRYPIWRAVMIAIIAGAFDIIWLLLWWVNRKRIAEEWDRWRADRADDHQFRASQSTHPQS